MQRGGNYPGGRGKPADVVDGDVPQLLIHGGLALLTGVGAEGGLRVLVGHMDLYLAASCQKKLLWAQREAAGRVAAFTALTWDALAVIFVELHQNRRRNHQEVSEGRGDGVGHDGEALAQPAQTLNAERDGRLQGWPQRKLQRPSWWLGSALRNKQSRSDSTSVSFSHF